MSRSARPASCTMEIGTSTRCSRSARRSSRGQLDRCEAVPLDLAILAGGHAGATELQRIAPDQAQRVVLLSGGAFTAQTRERLAKLGAPQLAKPVTAKQLRDCVLQIATDAKL